VFYWHGTGSNPAEAQRGLGSALAEIQKSGGVVASFSTTTGAGTNTGNKVWYTGDFAMADIILACAVQQGLVDARQVFTAGCSAGGLQAGAMVYGRSSYLAAAMPNSGGIIGKPALQNPAHVPALITTHGGPDDFVLISFATVTATLDADVHAKGGFVVNCNHGLGHCESPPDVIAAQWQFLKAHPYGVAPEPYTNGLPADFPAVCQIIE
jgi:poly(3-hydroxybutyrate) depolymerase